MCATVANNTIHCDRTRRHTDICFMRGDIRTARSSSSILLFSSRNPNPPIEEKIRPYPRKWEPSIMAKIPELRLKILAQNTSSSSSLHQCDVTHNVTALFFSLGGYTGNVFHDFDNGIIPLYITSQHFRRKVVFVVLEYRDWWRTKYEEILAQLSEYPLIDFRTDRRTHCFPRAIMGVRYHDFLTIGKSSGNFRPMLDQAYRHGHGHRHGHRYRPKFVLVARTGTRAIENEAEVARLVEEIGFTVEVLRPASTMPMSTVYDALNSCDAMMGVHGAALTHFLFMRPGSVFVQIVPLGVADVARLCYGDPAVAMGITYLEYSVQPTESSLYRMYGGDDPIVRDPESVKRKGWQAIKDVYLGGQNVTLDLSRLKPVLSQAYHSIVEQRS